MFFNLLFAAGLFLAYKAGNSDPQSSALPAFFGLTFPVWAIANVFFVFLWLLRGKWYMLISLALIIWGWGHFDNFFNLTSILRSSECKEEPISVMSYNVRLFDWYNWKENSKNRDKMFDQILAEDPDIICFQEFFYQKNGRKGKRFATRDSLKEILSAKYVHDRYTTVLHGDEHYGIATFSKYPISGRGNIKFDQERGNLCIYTDVNVDGKTLRVFNAHVASIRFSPEDYRFMKELQDQKKDTETLDGMFSIGGRLHRAFEKRAVQVSRILEEVERSPHPVVLCGDFNDTPVSYTYSQLTSSLHDSFRAGDVGVGSTYAGEFPAFRIDYIMHGDSLNACSYRRLPPMISDHRAIMAEMEWASTR